MKDIKNRTKKFTIDCWFLCDKSPNTRGYNAYQLIQPEGTKIKTTSNF